MLFRYRSQALGRLTAFALLLFGVHCADDDGAAGGLPQDGGASDDGGNSQSDGAPGASTTPVDILFVVDNSHAMGAKQAALGKAVGALFSALESTDVHVGVISSSIGNAGDYCSGPRSDDEAHLLTRISQIAPGTVLGTQDGFLSLGPGAGAADVVTLAERTAALIRGADQYGCGLEALLEAMYRFVAAPDPPLAVTVDAASSLPVATGVDYTLLAQRKAFFREDSTVAIVLVTDGDDSSVDYFSVGGFGHAYFALDFPGSQVKRAPNLPQLGTTAARGTSACAAHPADPDCTSCAFAATCDPLVPECQKLRADVACTTAPPGGPTGPGYDGFLAPADDAPNVRAFDMKRRFGVDPLYPIARYVAALSELELPDRASEHPESNAGGERVIGAYTQAKSCSNPLFSSGLPLREGDELCKLGPGKRTPQQVILGVVGGIVGDDLTPAVSWTKLLGEHPEVGDTTGIDPHMLASFEPRAGLTGADLPLGDNGADPIHGREWRTDKKELEFACTFPLDANIDCTASTEGASCDCPTAGFGNPPLCTGPEGTTQTRGWAQPSVRELLVARALGARAVLSSVCSNAGGYRDFTQTLAQRINAAKRP